MRQGLWRSITAQVWALVAICTVLVAGAVSLNMRADVRHERDIVRRDLAHRGETAAATVAQTVRPGSSLQSTMEKLVDQPRLSRPDGCVDLLGPLQRVIPSGYLAVLDARGTVRCAVGQYAELVGRPALAGATELRRVVAGGRFAASPPYRDPVLGVLAIATVTPVPAQAGVALVFATGTQSLAGTEPPGGSMTTTVVDAATGLVLARLPEHGEAVGVPVGSTTLAGVVGRSGALLRAEDLDGTTRLFTASQVPGSEVWVLVGEAERTAYASARKSLWRNALLGALIVLTVTAMGVVLQRGVARPARRLRTAIAALADDPDASPAPTSGPLELAALASAFNDAAAARRRADGLTRALVEHATDLLLVIDPRGVLTYVAPAAARMLGTQVGDNPLRLARLVHLADREPLLTAVRQWLRSGERELRTAIRVRDLRGEVHHLDVHAQDLREDPSVGGIVLAARDDTDRKRAEEDLAFRARHDGLTGLANRARVLEELRSRLADAGDQPVAVLFIDLDRFKLINDSHGHAVGDQVLVALADRLFGLTGNGDVVGRLGGDEFVLVAPSASTPEAAMVLADRVRAALDGAVTVAQRELFVSGSIGVAFGEQGDNAATVLRNADTAMYRAKALGRNCAALFDDEMRQQARRLLRTEVDLHRALEREELVVHYQPLVALARGEVRGVEALVRWRHPARGLVSPSEFVPVAEETGLVVPIGRFVLEQACAFAAANPSLGYVSVNVSPRQLSQPDVVQMVREVLQRTGLAPERLCLEVTETLLVMDAEAAALTLAALHADGVRVAIDDFGTGWASLTYLQRFPVDTIKLDKSFVSRVTDDPGAAAIVAALIQLAHSMALTVVAEGVESHAQAEFLRSNGCDTGQGYLFSRPVPPGELAAAVRVRQADRLPVPRPPLAVPPVGP